MQRQSLRSVLFGLSLFLVPSNLLVNAQDATLQPTDNLVVQGLPKIPAAVVDEVRRYTEARGASFMDWHPTKREMLIGTRFANSNQVHWIKMPGGARSQITFFNEPVASATFQPHDGKYFVFSRDTGGNEFGQLFRYDVANGNVSLLTDGGRSQNGSIVWTNAKDQAIYASTRRNGADRDLWLMNPESQGASHRIVAENQGGGWAPLDFSPNDKQLLAMEMISINQSNLYMIEVPSGKKTPLTPTDEIVAYRGGQFAPDGKGFYLTSDQGNEFQQLCYMDLESKKIEPLTNLEWDVESFELSHDGKRLAFSVNEAGVSKLYLMEVASKKYSPIAGLPNGVVSLGAWHSSDLEISMTINSARSTSDVYSYNVDSKEVFRWTESELGGLIADQLVEPKLINWSSFDEKKITGFYYPAPSNFEGKRPVIINIHGGPEGQTRPTFLGRNNYFLNELGVAIIFPNIRGSSGYGKTFVQLDNGLKRLDSVKDIGALLDWIAKQPELDANRVMITGGSYGGYMTLACAVDYNDRIKCSLDVVGISHFGTFLKATESYRRDLRRVEYGDERIPEVAEFFEKMAPLNNAGKISKPLFIVQGGNDPRVPLSEAEQMVAKVKANGGPIWYLMAKDEGHGFRKKNNADFQFYATIQFIREHLLK